METGGVRVGPNEQLDPFVRIAAAEAKALLEDRRTTWIDVREPSEWQQNRIPGAILVPLDRLLAAPRQYLPSDRVVFYCAHGIRSAVACEVAAAVGLNDVYNLEGGIQDWAACGYPLES
jgi:rhodanese-related sulfurtransferase